METKHENWKRKPHFYGQHGNGLGNENLAGMETKGTKTPSFVSMAVAPAGWEPYGHAVPWS